MQDVNLPDQTIIIFALAFLLAVAVLVMALFAYLYKRQQNQLMKQEMMYREIAGRRRIRAADKKYVSSVTITHARSAECPRIIWTALKKD